MLNATSKSENRSTLTKFWWIVILFICTGYCGFSQNLVVNPSFENVVMGNLPCMSSMSPAEFDNAISNWTSPNGGSPDVYHTSQPNNCMLSVASSSPNASGQQPPRTGEAYTNLITVVTAAPPFYGYREYVQGELTSPLVVGDCYHVSFWVSLADNATVGSNNIGVKFSAGGLQGPNSPTDNIINATPDYEHASVITEKSDWVEISFVYTPTVAGLDHITIGNFSNFANTTTSNVGAGSLPSAYYYLDDVSVELFQGDLDISGSACSDDMVFTANVNDPGATFQWYQDGNPLANETNADLLLSQNNYPDGNYSCEVTFPNGCVITLEGEWINEDVAPVAAFDAQTTDACDMDNLTLYNYSTAGSGSLTSTSWNFGDGQTSSEFEPSHFYATTGTYTVTLITTNSTGCSDTTAATVDIYCYEEAIELDIPNVFTPNNDGDNDVFSITASGFESVQCTILNRWGNVMSEFDALNEAWDGMTPSGLASEGVYFYLIKGTDVQGELHEKHGHLTLIAPN